MLTPLDHLPDWSKTIDPNYRFDPTTLKPAALEFLNSPQAERAREVSDFNNRYCAPRLELSRASGLYLFFRVIFDLPASVDRDKARIFGGWLHPSIGEKTPFDLAWPVSVNADRGHFALTIHRFQGYVGKGYNAIGEFEYFSGSFRLRTEREIEAMILQ